MSHARVSRRSRAPTWIELGTPEWARASQLSSATEADQEEQIEPAPVERLCSHEFCMAADPRKRTARDKRFRFNQTGQLSILFTLIACLSFLLAGSVIPSFRMRSMGIVGKLLDLGDEGSYDRPFSIFSVTNFVSSQAEPSLGSILGVRGMCLLFFFCSFVAPFIQVVVLIFLWFAEVTLSMQKKLLMANEILGQRWIAR